MHSASSWFVRRPSHCERRCSATTGRAENIQQPCTKSSFSHLWPASVHSSFAFGNQLKPVRLFGLSSTCKRQYAHAGNLTCCYFIAQTSTDKDVIINVSAIDLTYSKIVVKGFWVLSFLSSAVASIRKWLKKFTWGQSALMVATFEHIVVFLVHSKNV